MPYTRSWMPSFNEGLMDLREVLRASRDGAKSLKDQRPLKKDLVRAARDENECLTRRIVPVAGLSSRRRILHITGLGTQGTGATPVNTTEIKIWDAFRTWVHSAVRSSTLKSDLAQSL